jgi:hypothetical protein
MKSRAGGDEELITTASYTEQVVMKLSSLSDQMPNQW